MAVFPSLVPASAWEGQELRCSNKNFGSMVEDEGPEARPLLNPVFHLQAWRPASHSLTPISVMSFLFLTNVT